jgi:hypothetical protein
MAYDSGNVRRGNFNATWDTAGSAHDLGGVDAVKIDAKLLYDPIKIGSAGKMKLDEYFDGLGDDAKVSITVREVTLARIRKLCPWDNGSGSVDLTPPVGTKMYQYAKQLLLHPTDQGAGTTLDIAFFKTVPVNSFQVERNGVKQDEWVVEFAIFPDATKLAAGTPPYWEVLGV